MLLQIMRKEYNRNLRNEYSSVSCVRKMSWVGIQPSLSLISFVCTISAKHDSRTISPWATPYSKAELRYIDHSKYDIMIHFHSKFPILVIYLENLWKRMAKLLIAACHRQQLSNGTYKDMSWVNNEHVNVYILHNI